MRRRGVSTGLLDPLAGTLPATETDQDPAEEQASVVRATRRTLRTEFEFELPRGYVDENGTVHTEGAMRLATARDELAPLIDLRVKQNPAYLSVVLLSLVVTRIGSISPVRVETIERLFASDLAFLQDLYRRINAEGHTRAEVTCPSCETAFEVDIAGGRPGES